MVPASKNSGALEIRKRVVHPAHHPFLAKSKAAVKRRFGHARESRAFFRNGFYARECAVSGVIEVFKERNSLQIFLFAIDVWQPFSFFARIIMVQHRGYRIYPKSVDVVFVEPEQCIGNQETADLVSSIVENITIPVGMETPAHVGIFKQMRTVEKI